MQLLYDIFISATFRTNWSKNFNLKLEQALSNKGYTCYLPQRDSEQLGNKKQTFLENIKGVKNSKLILALGVELQSANWGLELGYAYAKQKPIIILVKKDQFIELMPEGAANHIIQTENIDNLVEYLPQLLTKIEELLPK